MSSSPAAGRSGCVPGLRVHGIYGRRVYDTWERTQSLLRSGALDVEPIITHRLDLADWHQGMELIGSRHAGKIVLTPDRSSVQTDPSGVQQPNAR